MTAPKLTARPLGDLAGHRIFRTRGEQRYSLEILPTGITFEVDRLRRSSHELWGEMSVTVNGSFPQAKTVDGVLVVGDLNFSSVTARASRAKLLADRSGKPELDWYGLLEEFATKTIAAERLGPPDLNLQAIPKPPADRMLHTGSIDLPVKHPMILFGDGGTAKSYLALFWAGLLMAQGVNVLYVDWECTAEDHRERLELLFGPAFPAVRYLPCYRSIRDERDRIKRAMLNQGITYLIFDSVGVACGGDPSSSEAAVLYHQAIRELGEVGSLHIAHVTKAGDDQKPFGSVFWHNMARVTVNVKAEETGDQIALALHPRKRNLRGKRPPPSALTLTFEADRTTFAAAHVKDFPGLAEGLPIAERVADAVKYTGKSRRHLSEELGVDYNTLQRTIYREIKRGCLVEIEGARKGTQKIALKTQIV